jgi:hypothetical protein
MTTMLNFGRDVQGYNAYAPPFATDLKSATLANGSAKSFTVPSNYKIWNVNFSYQSGVDIWVSINGTAAVPAGSSFASTNSILNPASRTVTAGTVISCITANTTADIGIEMYAVS